MAQMSRLMPDHGYDFGDRARTLPADGGVLLAGDAFATISLDS